MGKIIYKKGDKLGPYNIEFVEEVEPYIKPDGRKERKGKFICPYCGENFETVITRIRIGKTKSCGCIKINNLEGKRFGKLTVIKPLNKRGNNGSIVWECLCDCGEKCEVSSKYLIGGQRTTCTKCSKSEDLINQKFGKLTVIESLNKKNKNGSTIWKCICDCGTIINVNAGDLKSGHTKSCGCLRYEQKDITNQKFGHLTALYFSGYTPSKRIKWHCICDCGKEIDVLKESLISGHTTSCGCHNVSKGEEKIEIWLNDRNIEYIVEKIFKDCINPKTKQKLRFDFYLPKYNCCIEYDGKQHFCACGGWSTEEHLKETQYRDNIKNQYCKNNDIKLIRIPYTEYDNIESILDRELL